MRVPVASNAAGHRFHARARLMLTEDIFIGIEHTPMGRFGEPQDLVGTVIWLLSNAAKFVTGIVVPIDGGYSAYGGV